MSTRRASGAPVARVRPTRFARIAALVLVTAAAAAGVRAVVAHGGGQPGPAATGPGTPPPTSPPPTHVAPAGLPECRNGVLPAPHAGYGQWRTTLLDTTYALPSRYVPPDLVSVSDADFDSDELVRSFLIPDLAALRRAAAAAGNPVEVLVGYRSYVRQRLLFRERVRELGRAGALAKTARPGHSEHQLGTTIDFRTPGSLDVTQGWESTKAGAWMAGNAWRYGFLMSYPSGRTAVTCYRFEPWHYRYFGRPLAARIHASGLTPREYLWREEVREAHRASPPTTES
jgi:zinc D-Ala-D-Ala carboxypeptidase